MNEFRDGFVQCYHLMIEDAETIKPSLSATLTQTIAMPGLTATALPSALTLIPPPFHTTQVSPPHASSKSQTSCVAHHHRTRQTGATPSGPEPLWALVNCSGTLLLTNLAFGIQVKSTPPARATLTRVNMSFSLASVRRLRLVSRSRRIGGSPRDTSCPTWAI